MADYIDDVYKHHSNGNEGALGRGEFVHDLFRNHEENLLQPLLDYLSAKNSVRLLGPSDASKKAPTVAVALKESPEAVAGKLSKHGIMAGGGDFYAVRCIKAQGIDPTHGVLRLSFVHYTNKSEIDKLITALDNVL
jgi:selenocysteine lyase/cysteine desulfurase